MWNVPPGSDYERFEDVSSLTSPAQVNVVAPWGCPPDQGLKPDCPDKDVIVQTGHELETKSCTGYWTVADKGDLLELVDQMRLKHGDELEVGGGGVEGTKSAHQ